MKPSNNPSNLTCLHYIHNTQYTIHDLGFLNSQYSPSSILTYLPLNTQVRKYPIYPIYPIPYHTIPYHTIQYNQIPIQRQRQRQREKQRPNTNTNTITITNTTPTTTPTPTTTTTTLQYNRYNTIQYNTIPYHTIQYNTIQHNTTQHYAIRYPQVKSSITNNLLQYCFIIESLIIFHPTVMDNLWTRRSNSSKLSLSTGNPTTNGSTFTAGDHPARGFGLGRRHGDSSSHSTKNPFNSMSPSASSLSSPTTGASSAFGLGSGAFASFGNSKGPKTPGAGGALDFGSVMGGSTKTPTLEKNYRDLGSKASKISLTDSKTATPPPSHQFRHGWVFWYRPPISKSNGFVEYEKTLHPMAAFNSAEELF
ncbi:hypothetical protein EYC84_011541 [Monilinia fructicola]|uniref:Uncharacterized protein n=1 Tax=Monilinia fructicola TaxID=38448 RepID=A0A5M9J7X3_MONFR|nr:hypothetical protein EYC84_011541 [Monilinia fructicola]